MGTSFLWPMFWEGTLRLQHSLDIAQRIVDVASGVENLEDGQLGLIYKKQSK